MASAINFNTVWTSIFEPLPTFGFLKRLATRERVGRAARPAVPGDGVRRVGVVLRVGSAVRNWKVGDRVTAHCLHVDDQDPSAHDDSMMATNQRIWGFETNFGGLAESRGREGQSAHAEARAPHVGGVGVQRAVQLHQLPDDREPERLADDAGAVGAGVGRDRRHRRVRGAVREERRRHTGRCRVVGEARPSSCARSAATR